ncbi:hypothetical protein CSUB01_06040 [Colletotrichum sublineola]|uniref:Zn(2)-C6 fungal-type domain-containing protein n=1 Tax=Colletotrichum sublineola TaxID=1173701 RepID=A0A066X379_COLSU|nr:hypothetical protein CSUB01_06040 [Colletotrichum sublineola]
MDHRPSHTTAPDPAPTRPSMDPAYFNTVQQQKTNYGPPNSAPAAPWTGSYYGLSNAAPAAPSTNPNYFNTVQQQETNYGSSNTAPAAPSTGPYYGLPNTANQAPPPALAPDRGRPSQPSFLRPLRRPELTYIKACDNCRRLKSKCDEERPCKICKETGVECKYREGKPKQIENSTENLQNDMKALQNTVENFQNTAEELQNSVEKLLNSMHNPHSNGKRLTAPDETLENEQAPKRAKVETHAPTQIHTPA